AIIFGDLDGKLDVLRVACCKCDRAGKYSVAKLIARYGPNAKLVDWKDELTADCQLPDCGSRYTRPGRAITLCTLISRAEPNDQGDFAGGQDTPRLAQLSS